VAFCAVGFADEEGLPDPDDPLEQAAMMKIVSAAPRAIAGSLPLTGSVSRRSSQHAG
jgi:hypothetical protein